MPRAIANIGQGNPATYKLGASEEFAVLAVSFSLVALAGAGSDNLAWLDYRDSTGRIIHLQPLSPGDGTPMFYSLAVEASEFQYPNVNDFYVPQDSEAYGNNYVSQRLTPQTLTPGCMINAYKSKGDETTPTDPITNLSTFYTIPDLHLWVQDAAGRKVLPPNPPPLLTHVAA